MNSQHDIETLRETWSLLLHWGKSEQERNQDPFLRAVLANPAPAAVHISGTDTSVEVIDQ